MNAFAWVSYGNGHLPAAFQVDNTPHVKARSIQRFHPRPQFLERGAYRPGATRLASSAASQSLLAAATLFGAARDRLPSTALHLLSNGRLFCEPAFARALARVRHADDANISDQFQFQV